MSLQLAAQHLSRQGRGGDSTLVHMSPREVKGLNDLAMAHGGQLSINPQTGLPEAGFLSSILPMVAGFALNAAVPGLGSAMGGFAIPAIVGGGMALMSGSLQKGLMAGLGAYGGANLGQALAAQGVEQATAAELAKNTVYPEQLEAIKQAAQTKFIPPVGDQTVIDAAADQYRSNISQLGNQAAGTYNTAQTGAQTAYDALDLPGKLSRDFSTLTSPGGASGLFDKVTSSPMSLLKTVGSAAAPAIGEAMKPKTLEEEKADKDMGQRYGFSMNPTGGQKVQPGQDPLANTQSSTTTPFPTPDIYGKEQRYFSPSYTNLTPEEAKKMYGYAEGGTAQSDPKPAEQPFPMPQYTNAGKQPLATPPADPPALLAFKQMQAQRAAQPQTPQYAPTPATGGYLSDPTPAPTTVEGLYTKYLNRASDKGGLDFWNKRFGPTVDADEAALFRSSAEPELAAKRGESIPTTVEGLYRTYLDRAPDPGGLDFWNKHFGSDVDASELARFKHATIPELTENKRLFESTGGTLAREFNNYLGQTVGVPNQLKVPTAPPPTTTNLADSGFTFDPITQRYTEIKGTAPETSDDPLSPENLANNFHANPPFDRNGQIYPSNAYPYGPIQRKSAAGGLMDAYAAGGMTEADRMATASSYIGGNTSYPQALARVNQFSTPAQMPTGDEVISKGSARIDLSTGEERLAGGGISHLGDYSDGGRLLRGPGDGVSDSIPAMIGKRQPARLADGEFVVPARIVSELGNGSTEAGARKLYAMMDRIQKARGKTVGKNKVAKNSRSEKYLPA
jgi:hypothetical protein